MSRTTHHFRLIAWNIRAGGGQRAAAIGRAIRQARPDALILSEFRGSPASTQLAEDLSADLPFQMSTTREVDPNTNALLVAAREPLRRVALRGRPREPGRWLMARLASGIALGGMHIPNQVTGRKPQYHREVLALVRRWRGGPAILAGDTNSGRIGLDEERPVFNRATDQWQLDMQAAGWLDAFRLRYGDRREYTWYSPGHDNGFRLDQAFLSPDLHHRLRAARHVWMQDPLVPASESTRRDALSDHAALFIDVAVSAPRLRE